jgi:hypothetical protein
MMLPGLTLDDEEIAASVEGILQCLRVLAEEAALLKLNGTFSAIEHVLATATVESGCTTSQGPIPGMTLH